jgi:septum formation protein
MQNINIWNPQEQLILASNSAIRRRLLEQAGIPFEWETAKVDERAVEAAFRICGGNIEALPVILAQGKSIAVSRYHPGALCLGADQVLILDGRILHKAETLADAANNLQELSGRAHLLISAFAIARDTRVVCDGMDTATMTMRLLDANQSALYLRCAGSSVLESVGAYMFESAGVHIFEKTEGNKATILGLPILEVLSGLRREGALLL